MHMSRRGGKDMKGTLTTCSYLSTFFSKALYLNVAVSSLAEAALALAPQSQSKLQLQLQLQSRRVEVPSLSGIGITSFTSSKGKAPDNKVHGNNNYEDVIYIGTKRGKLKQIIPQSVSEVICEDILDADGELLKPYPIYAMVHLEGERENEGSPSTKVTEEIACGGGDRYLTIWSKMEAISTATATATATASAENEDEEERSRWSSNWRITSKLGPHTGWVKDVAYFKCMPVSSASASASASATIVYPHRYQHQHQHPTETLFSIGCNCIEVWRKEVGGPWTHYRKLQIESCAEQGATLSSDLLCLGVHDTGTSTGTGIRNSTSTSISTSKNTGTSSHLFAAGVDGRIHIWGLGLNEDTQALELPEVDVTAAHDGRVNKMLICNKANLLISVGNDSMIQCRQISFGLKFDSWPLQSVSMAIDGCLQHQDSSIENENENESGSKVLPSPPSPRLVCMCVINETAERVTIALGNSSGGVFIVDIINKNTNSTFPLQIEVQQKFFLEESDGGSGSGNGSVVHTLVSSRGAKEQEYNIHIGHSKGLVIWNTNLIA